MPERVAVVTDSTSYLPAGLADEHGLTVVPLQVVVGGRSLSEGTEVTSGEIAEALVAGRTVTTSRPSPLAFVETYRRLAAGGARGIVSVHLSADLSGTVDAARVAARQLTADGVQVEVVDSRLLAMGLGYAAMAAADAAARGSDPADVAKVAARRSLATGVWLYVDTLEYLRRGGRIGTAAAWLGSALAVKPLLHLADGRIEPVERVRTTSRALVRLEEIVVAEAGERPVDIAVQHLAAADRADELAHRLRSRLPGVRRVVVDEVGAVVGAHVGPGMLGVVVAPASR
ncbi:MAG TPA: DegV family protein [Kineosporiaceae bacterium]|jgi:DegV family protein with EDD domain|nr:DegV family protein [Kineosporiaceae bacterium]